MSTVSSRHPGALAVLFCGQGMASFDGSAITVAAPGIQTDLRCSGAAVQLLLTGYLLAFGVLVVPGARLGDALGHRRVFLVGLAGFTAASLICGVAAGTALLISARLLQGASAAVMLPQVLSIVQVSFTGFARERALGGYSATLAGGVICGQVLGGMLIRADLLGTGWRSVFLVDVPIGLLLIMVGSAALPATRGGPAEPLRLGDAALAAVASGLLFGPLLLGREQGWPIWTWPCLLAAGLVGTCFVARQRRAARAGRSPLLDVSVLTAPGVARRLVSACLVMGGYAGVVLALTLHLQRGLHFTPARAGLTFAPYAVGFAVCSMACPRLPARLRRVAPPLGSLTMAASIAGVAVLARSGWPTVPAAVLLAIAGAGHAGSFGPVVAAMTTGLLPAQAGAASGWVSTGTLLAEALGITALGGLYLSDAGAVPTAATSASALGLVALGLGLLAIVAAVLGAGHRTEFLTRTTEEVKRGDAQGEPHRRSEGVDRVLVAGGDRSGERQSDQSGEGSEVHALAQARRPGGNISHPRGAPDDPAAGRRRRTGTG